MHCHDTTLFPRLVLGCINTDYGHQVFLQHFSRSTKFSEFCFRTRFFGENCCRILKIRLAHFVDLAKCCKMSIWLQKSVLIQPRTSLGKSDVSWRPAPRRAGPPGRGPPPSNHDRRFHCEHVSTTCIEFCTSTAKAFADKSRA